VKRALRAPRQVGFTLLPVILAMTLIAAIAFLLNRDNGMNAQMIYAQSDLDRARYAAEAGLQAVNYQVQQASCSGGFPTSVAPVTNSNFGGAAYSAYASQASGTSLTLSSTGSYNGASVTLTRPNATVFNSTMQSATAPDAQDTYVGLYIPNNNAGAATSLTLWSGNGEPMVKFDLSSLPAGSRIVPYYSAGALQAGATLSLYQSGGPTNSGQIGAYLITHSWVEGTGFGGASTTGATWNTYDGVNAWPSGPGAGYDSRALSATTYASGTGWRTWDITDAALAWMDGVYPNYGVWIRPAPGSAISNVAYVSRENANTAERPYVSVNYLAPCTTTTNVLLAPIIDTEIDSTGSGNGNYGLSTTLLVNRQSGTKEQRALLNFEILCPPSPTNPCVPANKLIQSATLQLYVSLVASPAITNLTVWRVTQSWLEGTKTGSGNADGATWKTSDGITSWTNGAPLAATGEPTVTLSSSFTSGWVTFDVTGLVQAWVDGFYPVNGLALLSNASSGISFNSKDNSSSKPLLTIVY